jgi:hypothetical protein
MFKNKAAALGVAALVGKWLCQIPHRSGILAMLVQGKPIGGDEAVRLLEVALGKPWYAEVAN